MKWTAMFLLLISAGSTSATVIDYEAKNVLFSDDGIMPTAFYGCMANFRFSVDTVAEEVVSSSASCPSAGIHLESTSSAAIKFTDEGLYNNERAWLITFDQQMSLVGDPASIWGLSLIEHYFFGARQEALSSFHTESGWAKIFVISEYSNGERVGSEIGYGNHRIHRVPEPAILSLLALGVVTIGIRRRLH